MVFFFLCTGLAVIFKLCLKFFGGLGWGSVFSFPKDYLVL